jgi:hypothetical protein
VATTIPNVEPATIVAGDSVAWTKSVTDYPATDGWTLNYSLQRLGSTAAPIAIVADPDGANYSVAVDADDTETWAPANYIWTAFVDDGATERHRVATGTVTILANPAAALGSTHASRTLALIDLAIEGRVPRGLTEFSIQGQQITKIAITDLVKLRSVYADWVRNEVAQDRINRGLSNPRNSFARFTRVGGIGWWPFGR